MGRPFDHIEEVFEEIHAEGEQRAAFAAAERRAVLRQREVLELILGSLIRIEAALNKRSDP